ncbi:hypothetical protein TNCV_3049721 [Trichonephila clavipes]|nr:hypothetical protein TNCV_3049721 [Trichonephila clavipes]
MIPSAGPMWRCIMQQFSNLLTTVSPNSNPTIALLPAEAGFISKRNFVPFYCSCPRFIAPLVVQTPGVCNQGCKRSNGRLTGIPLCCKRRQVVRADTE